MARRLRGKAWGNALGGWRKQRRNARGQFSGGGSKSKAVAKRRKPSRKARKHSRLSQDRVVGTSVLMDMNTGQIVGSKQYTRTGYQQRSITRHQAVGALVGTAVMPGVGTAAGIIIGGNIGAQKNPAKTRRMPI